MRESKARPPTGTPSPPPDPPRRKAEEVAEADRRKDEFLAMLAHELRNPLAPIQNALQIMRQVGTHGAVAERAREMLERQVRHLTRLVDDLLDASRLSRGEISVQRGPMDLVPVLARAAEAARPLMDERGHQFEVSLPPAPLPLKGDEGRLEQAVGNLLDNAAKFTEPGGRVALEARCEGGEAVIRVRDSGMGMEPETLAHAFDLFSQGDHSLERLHGGLGVGLALVRRVVELHGGSVLAASAGSGQGSEFVVRLPVADAVPEARGPADAPAPAPRRLRVLVVDDNKDAARSLATVLRLWGHEVRVAYDGLAAVEAAKADCPELILLDIGIPLMDGYQVATQLRRGADTGRSVLVALTGYGQAEARRRSEEAGFDAHLTKPVTAEQLQDLLHRPELAASCNGDGH